MMYAAGSYSILASGTNDIILNGRNVVWSPSQNILLYATLGKTSGAMIWHLFDPVRNTDGDTLFYGKGMTPAWSLDGNNIAYQNGGSLMVIDNNSRTTQYKTSVSDIDSIAWTQDTNKIMFSGDNKIFFYDISARSDFSLAQGMNPVFIRKTHGLLFMDDNFNLYSIPEGSDKVLIMSDVDSFAVSPDQTKLAAYVSRANRLMIFDLDSKATNSIGIQGSASGFCFDSTGGFFVYSLNDKDLLLKVLRTGYTLRLPDEGSYPSFSFNSAFLSFQKSKNILIVPFSKYYNLLAADPSGK
jgi:hypothetical protein